ncbi:MAG TPA: hypothetical protein VEB19_10305 [Gemmatimonadaceae bacterium]|nr:hypothetical protein [Gemmatimonadaceae bacterium]
MVYPEETSTMPVNKDLKRLVRARMEKTGEAYTAARAQLLKKPDYAKVAGMADAKVQAKTGRTWEEWMRVLDSHDASTMAHRDIAMLVSGTYGAPDWWTDGVSLLLTLQNYAAIAS